MSVLQEKGWISIFISETSIYTQKIIPSLHVCHFLILK